MAAVPESANAFDLVVDRSRDLLIVTKRGYWDIALTERFADAFRGALRRMRVGGGCRYCLVDATDFAIQSNEVSLALQALVESFDPQCPGRMAGVVSSSLSKLQASRHGATGTRQVFAARAQAEAWLFSDRA
jgi:hypothetical protein